jgi:hypothetical protein
MATIALLQSWKRTERYLLDARAKLSPVASVEHATSLGQFEKFIEHNELGLAYDWLESIARESDWESTLVLKSLGFAAASMERIDRQRAVDERLTLLHGYKYETLL